MLREYDFKTGLVAIAFAFAGLMPASVQAAPIEITPTTGVLNDTRWQGDETGQAQIDLFIASILGSSTEQYKADFDDGAESGALKDSYTTVFSPLDEDGEPNGAVITYDGGGFVLPTAFLLVKDGNANPAWYLFDLTAIFNWNGTDTLSLTGFWENTRGSISHVTLYGGEGTPGGGGTPGGQQIPEPASLLLLAGGIGAAAFTARRRRQSR